MNMNRSGEIGAIAGALAEAQGEIENAVKNSNNPAFRSKYADLAAVTGVIREVFPKYGLAYTQGCGSGYNQNGKLIVAVTTLLTHKSGEWIESSLTLPCSKEDAQGVGSAITYGRRYSLAAMAGIAQEDDDGNAAVQGPSAKEVDAACKKFMQAEDKKAATEIWARLDPELKKHRDVVAAAKAANDRFAS